MSASRRGPRRLAVLLAVLALAGVGCATQREKEKAEGQDVVPRPEWRVGDRWVFQRTMLSGATLIVTHQVVAATLEGYTIRVFGGGLETTRRWTPDVHLAEESLAGGGTVRYEPPASYFVWPIGPAKTWDQDFQYTDGRNDGRYTNTWKVGEAIEPIDTVAGRFYALRVERWGGPRRLETYWYSPRARYWVRLEDYLRGYVEDLMEFRAWGS